MAQDLLPISDLTELTDPLVGTEDIPLNVPGPNTQRVKSRKFALPTDPLVLFAANGSITGGRVLTPGTGLTFNLSVDGQLIVSAVSAGGTGPVVYGNRSTIITAAVENDLSPPGWNGGLDKNGMNIQPTLGGTVLSGIVTGGMTDGQSLFVMNFSDTDTLTLLHESVLSAPFNRFHLPLLADLIIQPAQSVTLIFETLTNRLRVQS